MRSFLFCSSVLAAFILSVACGSSTPTPNTAKTPATAASPAKPVEPQAPVAANPVGEAKELFAAHCMICHKDTGKGGKVSIQGKTLNAEDLTSSKMAAKTDDQLTKYIIEGVPDEGMPAFKDKLTDEEVALLVGHIRSLQGKN